MTVYRASNGLLVAVALRGGVVLGSPADVIGGGVRWRQSLWAAGVAGLVTLCVWSAGAVGLSAGRGYELVSPPEKNGGDVLLSTSRSRAAVNGGAFSFASLVGFGDVRGMAISTEYLARRTAGGWVTHGITPRQDPLSGLQVLDGPGDAVFAGEFTADLSAGVVRANAFPQGDPNVSTVQNLFVRRDLLTPGAGRFELVTESVVPIPPPWTGFTFPPPPEIIPATYKPFFAAISADASHVIFESVLNLTQDVVDARLPRDAEEDRKLYEWTEGIVRYVGILPSDEGGGLATRSLAGRGAGGRSPFYTSDAISDDGSRIFFTTPDTGQLYMREDGSSTVRINAHELRVRSPAPRPSPAEFRAATPDGSRVFFTSDETLTDDDTGGTDLWRYDATAPQGSRLTRLSIDNVPGDDHTPPVQGVLGVSDDGEWAYFIALGALVPDMPAIDVLDPVIYQWHAGRTRFVGRLRPSSGIEEFATGEGGWETIEKTSRVSANGRFVMWMTRQGGQLDPHDHGDCGGDPCDEMYLFSADANGGAGEVWCASCDPDGGPATASTRFGAHESPGAAVRSSHLPRPLTEDGQAFFHTPEQLLPEDRNDKFDVYEFDTASESLSLISTGRADAENSFFLDSSASGDDVFFGSRERLVGWDVDGSYDVYDARVGGGFPEPPRPLPACRGDACRGALSGAPAARAPASKAFRGAGNVRSKARKPGRRCRRGKVRKRVRGRVRCVRRPASRRAGGRRVAEAGERGG